MTASTVGALFAVVFFLLVVISFSVNLKLLNFERSKISQFFLWPFSFPLAVPVRALKSGVPGTSGHSLVAMQHSAVFSPL
jgi:hypothetical protein